MTFPRNKRFLLTLFARVMSHSPDAIGNGLEACPVEEALGQVFY
jgi:hypothetical protein